MASASSKVNAIIGKFMCDVKLKVKVVNKRNKIPLCIVHARGISSDWPSDAKLTGNEGECEPLFMRGLIFMPMKMTRWAVLFIDNFSAALPMIVTTALADC
jgi:hypothetical protein